jgi:hypothetical protein
MKYVYVTAEVTLECELEYIPEELGFLEDGLQMVPDTPAQVELVSAKVKGLEMVELLAEWVVDDIIDKALLEVEGQYA